MDLMPQMKVLPAVLQRSVQAEGGAETLQNIQVQVQAEGGEEKTERGEADQDPEDLTAEVERHQPAGGGQSVRLHLILPLYLLYCLRACVREIFFP